VLYELGSNNEAELSLQVCAPSQIVNGGRRPLAIRANVLLSKGAEMDPFTMIGKSIHILVFLILCCLEECLQGINMIDLYRGTCDVPSCW